MTTTKVTLTPRQLVVEPLGWNKVETFTRRLQIPLSQIRAATLDPQGGSEPPGWRGPGLHLPGRRQGTFHAGGGRQFRNTAGHDPTVVVTLGTGGRYDSLVVSVDDPHQVTESINAAVEAG